jgi:sigma-E factor negative regulatory protein RseA
MTQEISALVDGEVDSADLDGIIKACHQSDQHKHAWRSYHLIGEALRAEHGQVVGLEQRILAQLQSEPTILAPRRRTWAPAFPRIALAAAASLATISAVAWLAFQQTPVSPPQVVAISPPPVSPLVTPRVDDFVLAHREFTAAPDALIPASFGVNGNGDGSR